MAEDTTQPNVEANPDNGATNQPQVEGNTNTQPQVTNEGKLFTQKNLDDAMAKTRGTAERETRRKILAELGLKDDEMDKLSAFKEAYQNSLSDEERKNQVMEDLQADNLKLQQDLEEKEYVIKALITLTGKNEDDVDKIVKMAKGLKTDDNSIEEAINEVISMIKVDTQAPAVQTTVENNPNMPMGQEIQQPSTVSVDVQDNPFKPGPTFNLTKQGQMIRTNPELAKKLATEAGVKLPI